MTWLMGRGNGRRGTYTLYNPLTQATPRNRFLPIRMHQFCQCSRAHKNRHIDLLSHYSRYGVPVLDVPQYPRPKPYPVKETMIRFMRHQICRCARIKRPCLRGQRFLSHGLKVVGRDEGREGWLLVLELNSGVLLRWWFGP